MVIIVNNEVERKAVKSAIGEILSLLEEYDEQAREGYTLQFQILEKLKGSIQVDATVKPLEATGTDPRCCGCGACSVTLPLSEFYK